MNKRIDMEFQTAYAELTGMSAKREGCYWAFWFTLVGQPAVATLRLQAQHPETGMLVRTITDRTGYVLAESLTDSWTTLRTIAARRM